MPGPWLLVLYCGVHVGSQISRSIRTARARRRSESPGKGPRGFSASSMLFMQLMILVVFWFAHDRGLWRPAVLGFQDVLPVPVSLLIGAAVYGVWMLAWERGLRLLGRYDEMEDACYLAMRSVWPRSRGQKQMMFVGVCLLNPVTEELVERGVLVYLLGLLIGSLPLAWAIGLLIHIGVHLYQPSTALWSQLFFYGLVAALLLSPAGLMGAIGFHFMGDLVPVLTFRGQLRRYRARHRERRLSLARSERSHASGSPGTRT
jgi:hypothetical protein